MRFRNIKKKGKKVSLCLLLIGILLAVSYSLENSFADAKGIIMLEDLEDELSRFPAFALKELAAPEEVDIDPARLNRIDTIIEEQIVKGAFPGAVLLIARRGKIIKHQNYGMAMVRPNSREMTLSTVFDLASLTKVLVPTPLALMLSERGLWELCDPVQEFLPQFRGNGRAGVTIWHLLTHTSGLPAWANLSQEQGKDKVLEQIYEIPLRYQPGERVIYSDLGFILLGAAIEKVAGKPLGQLAREWLFEPLGMKDTMFTPLPCLRSRIAPTEDIHGRSGVLIGQVHDGNAWAMGGISGHAGLFSTAGDLSIYAQMLLNRGTYQNQRILSSRSVELMTSLQTKGLNRQRGLGWLLQSPQTLSAGSLMSPQSFGHTGFTGTSLWIDPHYELLVILLTNRVHPRLKRGAPEISKIRALIHDSIVGAIISDKIP